jgi:ADP-heptose:LPS heptosyltransferase
LDTIPAETPYVFSTPGKIAQWRLALGPSDVPMVGLKWRTNETTGSAKSIPLEVLRPLLQTPGVRFVALEKNLFEDDARSLRNVPGLTVLAGRLRDFADTAAVVSLLDLVISVDTSVGHLAGAMGKPVWLALQFAADFRWLRARSDSPWYPSARLFRQPRIGYWTNVVTEVGDALRQHVQRPGGAPATGAANTQDLLAPAPG